MYYLGLDVGGTKIAAAVVNKQGTTLSSLRTLTHESEGADAVLRRIFALLDDVLAHAQLTSSQISGLGVGVPGAVDEATGSIHTMVNLTGWSGFPLRQRLVARYHVPVFLGNDANAAALGEYMFGNGAGTRHLLYITASTGIGGGIVVDGNLLVGASGAAGEVGHMILEPHGQPCNCGNRGCWETISSGTAIAKSAAQKIRGGEESSILLFTDIENIQAEHVFQARNMGDSLATEVTDRAFYFLGLGITNLVNALNPERVVIGGGVAQIGEPLFTTVENMVRQSAYGPAKCVRILPALLGAETGVIGAAALAMGQAQGSGLIRPEKFFRVGQEA
ncbi:MAG: Glucokinase [Firmicutes bacterium]|nr:Glucokinase [Bacillota bacterium]